MAKSRPTPSKRKSPKTKKIKMKDEKDKKPNTCPHFGCLFTSTSKLILGGHVKLRCPMLKPQFEQKNNKSRVRAEFPELDLSKVECGPFLTSGGYGAIYHGMIGSLRIIIKEARSSLPVFAKALTTEARIYKAIHGQSYCHGFARFFGSQPRIKDKENDTIKFLYLEALDWPLDTYFDHIWQRLNFKSKASILFQMLQRVKVLHRAGYLHRDLKLNNFMVKENQIYLIDFGCAVNMKNYQGTSVLGALQYLHIDAQKFTKSRFQHDLETLGWILAEVVDKNGFPWRQICRQVKNNNLSWRKAAPQVSKMKKAYLEDGLTSTTNYPYIFQFIDIVRKSCEDGFPTQLYRQLEELLKSVFQDSKLVGYAYDWKKTKMPSPMSPPESAFGMLLHHDLPAKEIEPMLFEPIFLPARLLQSHKLQKPLEIGFIAATLKRFGSFEVVNMMSDNAATTISRMIAAGSKPILWLCKSTHSFDQYIYAYVSMGNGKIISFSKKPVHPNFDSATEKLIFPLAEYQYEPWESGYRAFHWMVEVLRYGQVSEWLVARGYARWVVETKVTNNPFEIDKIDQ